MRKINILHLKTSATFGGAEILLKYWANYLDQNRFAQFIIFAEDGPFISIMKKMGMTVDYFPGLNSIMGLNKVLCLINFIKKNKIDLIHAHGARVNFWGSIAALLTGIPIISTEHNIDLWRQDTFSFNMIDKFTFFINKIRIGVSPAVCKMLYKQGINSDKIVCIENGIDVDRFNCKFNKIAKRDEFKVPIEAKIIGTIGRLTEQKGHIYLIESAAHFLNVFPSSIILIVGDGPLMETLKKQVKKLDIENKVIFAGHRDDIPEIMSIIDIFVLPSITEGLPLVLLEAMAAKKPIVASNVSGVPDVIKNGIEGLLIPSKRPDLLAEKINYLIKNSKHAAKLAQAAFNKVSRKYDAKIMISRYEKIYKILTSDLSA